MHRGQLRALLLVAALLPPGKAVAQPAGVGHGMEGTTGGVPQQLAASVHRALSCASCHGHGMGHAPAGTAKASCQTCHQQAATDVRRGPHGAALALGAQEVPTCVSCHGSHSVRSPRDPAAPTWLGRVSTLCGQCHAQAATGFVTSVHGHALAAGQSAVAPSCPTCHGAHTAAPVPRQHVADSCGTCHIAARLAFQRSIHGTAVVRGVLHAPTCTGCHGVHAIRAAAEPGSPTATMRVAEETCVRCHASVRITQMHDLPIQVVEDFRGSFHGLAAAAGDRRVANCASCHGSHEIRPSTSPLSSVNPANLGRTCGQCHPGAGERFAQGGVHHIAQTWGHRLVDWVRVLYAVMVAGVLGLMVVHNGLDFQRRWRDRRHRAPVPAPGSGETFLRFTRNERLQHWVAAGSFIALALTGFALRVHWHLPWVAGDAQQPTRALLHRGAAVLFLGVALSHLGYITCTARGRAMLRAMLPRLRSTTDQTVRGLSEWRELLATLKYNLGLAPARPASGRFTYGEKLEYWALVWGTMIMTGTGLALWFETPFLNRFPYWALDIGRTVHWYEAILAVGAIVVWHLYATVVNPDVFPLNRAMTRGTLTYEEMQREHPLDLPAPAQRQNNATDHTDADA